MRRVAFATGSRSEYGLLAPVVRACRQTTTLEVDLYATGTHLLKGFGRTRDEIEGPLAGEIPMYDEEGPATPGAVAPALARAVAGFARAFARRRPEILVVLGDRMEALAAVLAAGPAGIAIAHLHGGDRTEGGHIDESTRAAITAFAHLHLAASRRSAERLRRVGEEPWRIHVVGAPGLDAIAAMEIPAADAVARSLGIDPPGPFALLALHPNTVTWEHAGQEAERILRVLGETELAVVAVHPNGDPGSPAIVRALEGAAGPRFRVFPSLERPRFLAALARAALAIGNSSSAIIEGPALAAPAVNVGERNRGREHGANVVFTPSEPAAIRSAIEQVLDPAFRWALAGAPNPYGDGRTGPRVAALLASIALDPRLAAKRWSE